MHVVIEHYRYLQGQFRVFDWWKGFIKNDHQDCGLRNLHVQCVHVVSFITVLKKLLLTRSSSYIKLTF